MKFSPEHTYFICKCGHKNHNDLYKDLKGDLNVKFRENVEDTVKVDCEQCGRTYYLKLELAVEVEVVDSSIDEIFHYKDINNEDYDVTALNDLFLHLPVPLADGIYYDNENGYSVQDGLLVDRFSKHVHPDQLSFEI